MKLNGRELNGPNRVTLVLPREDDEDIIFVAQAVLNLDAFDELLVEPKPPVAIGKGGAKTYNKADPGYQQQMLDYNLKRIAYIIIKSLEPTDIEWETVNEDDPSTWLNYVTELQKAGFSAVEINRICNACMEANALDEEKLEEARKVFLHGRAEGENSFGQPT